ncbi:MAG: hypothetical protein JRE16_05990 [Deltaproteobacteria bacterium]|nr:hypothetical protein [Deltaproteobacteria bacterium]MBW2520743.1 hypothetical protein [Deltaproteobacteria bacterium]
MRTYSHCRLKDIARGHARPGPGADDFSINISSLISRLCSGRLWTLRLAGFLVMSADAGFCNTAANGQVMTQKLSNIWATRDEFDHQSTMGALQRPDITGQGQLAWLML